MDLPNTLCHERGVSDNELYFSAWLPSVGDVKRFKNVTFTTSKLDAEFGSLTLHVDSVTRDYLGHKEYAIDLHVAGEMFSIPRFYDVRVSDRPLPSGHRVPYTDTFEKYMRTQVHLIPAD